jgi:WD40 repeat protein
MQNRVPVAQWVGHTGSLVGLSWSPDGAWLASVAEDDVVLVWKR